MTQEPFSDWESAGGLLRAPPATSAIAQERVGPGRPNGLFFVALLVLAGAAVVVAYRLGVAQEETPAEAAGSYGLSIDTARSVSAAAFGVAIAATGWAARRLLHSGPAGLLAAGLVALDPALLAFGHTAVPHLLLFSLAMIALAGACSAIPLFHWISGLALAAAAVLDPIALLWCIPLAILLLVRGHIYAAPRHLASTAIQVVAVPLLGAVVHLLGHGGLETIQGCLMIGRWDALTLSATLRLGPTTHALHNPATWLAGMGALLFLAFGGIGVAVARFRMARLPSRIQLRLLTPLHPALSRGIWILLFAVTAPWPLLWLPLFAMALAGGVRELADDARGFGIAVAVALLCFAALTLYRAWDLAAGTADPSEVGDLLGLVPWTTSEGCA